jgi:hypothetical protein
MKYRFEHLGIAIISIFLISISFAKESKRNSEEGGPPFYMMSFFEFHEATAEQQKTYIELLKKSASATRCQWKLENSRLYKSSTR